MGIVSQKVRLADWGIVHIRCLATARNFSARWKGGELYVTIPPGMSEEEFYRILTKLEPQLRQRQPAERAPLYYDGFIFRADGWRVALHYERMLRPCHTQIIFDVDPQTGSMSHTVNYGPGFDFNDPNHEKFIARQLCAAAADFVHMRLIPQAMDIARALGVRPAGWDVMRGASRWGTCSSRGLVRLNERLAFVDSTLRRAIITHELAHLTHFDHTPAFHALWDKYMGRPTAPLRARLCSISLPLPK